MPGWETELAETVQPALARAKYLKSLEVGRGALARAGETLRRDFTANRIVVFADSAGFAAAGDRFLESASAAGFQIDTHVIPARPRPKASAELAETFMPLIAGKPVIPVALGSGVINDLVKYAAFSCDLPYAVMATAASMDGYASAGAPLSKNGFKITIPARCPRSIVADLDVIGAAPPEMAGWGYGDLSGKVPAGADWIIADALGIEPIVPDIWPLVQARLCDWLGDPEAVRAGGESAVAKLFAGLTMGGLAMEFLGSSRPASGAEHQIAHMWEMESLSFKGERVSHGACVAVGTVTLLALYDWLLGQDLSALDVAGITARAPDLETRFAEIDRLIPDSRIAERARIEVKTKHAEKDVLAARLETLVRVWPDLRQKLAAQVMKPAQMADLLARAGAPVRASDIGVSLADHKAATYAARFLRSRYTLFDLLDETGLLETAVEAVFADKDGVLAAG